MEGVGTVGVGHHVVDSAVCQPSDRRIATCRVNDRLPLLEAVGIAHIDTVVAARDGRGRRECPADRVPTPVCTGGVERQPQAVVRAGAGRAQGECESGSLVRILQAARQFDASGVHPNHIVSVASDEAAEGRGPAIAVDHGIARLKAMRIAQIEHIAAREGCAAERGRRLVRLCRRTTQADRRVIDFPRVIHAAVGQTADCSIPIAGATVGDLVACLEAVSVSQVNPIGVPVDASVRGKPIVTEQHIPLADERLGIPFDDVRSNGQAEPDAGADADATGDIHDDRSVVRRHVHLACRDNICVLADLRESGVDDLDVIHDAVDRRLT